MFIRIKKRGTSGNYGYLVENFWINNSSRQRIKSYLGKVYELQKIHDVQVDVDLELEYKNLILDLIKNELFRHGFQEKDGVLFLDKIFVNLNLGTVYNSKGRYIVAKLNDGYLCDYHLQQLLDLTIIEDEKVKGMQLANLLVSAGLKVNPECFVELYKKLPLAEKDETVEAVKEEILKEEEKVGLEENKEDVDEFGMEKKEDNEDLRRKEDLTRELLIKKERKLKIPFDFI